MFIDPSSIADEPTLNPPVSQGEVGAPARLVLTIALHPDIRRVGERAELFPLFDTRVAELSRLVPVFRAPDGRACGPVNDVHVSRSAVVIRYDGRGSFTLLPANTRLPYRVRGTPLIGPRELRQEELRDGVSVELSERIVLLLHIEEPVSREHPDYGLVGESAAIRRVRARIFEVAGLDVPVLLRGESGTGKELVARAIHAASKRAARPYVSVNVAALNRGTATAQLFGHVRGAFTGAAQANAGYFREADGGALFLDEIGECPIEVQMALLRALDTGEIQPLGSSSVSRVDARLIAATDTDLEQAVMHGEFRVSLLHRLAAYEIWLPPLRRRLDDVGRLLVHFLGTELAAHGPAALPQLLHGDASRLLPTRLIAGMLESPWPGNVRQLGNLARQMAITLLTGGRIEAESVLAQLARAPPRPAAAPPQPQPAVEAAPASAPAEISEMTLTATLRRNHWRIEATARELGISKTSLYTLIERTPGLRKARDLGRDEISEASRRWRGDLDSMADALGVSQRGLRLRMRELAVVPGDVQTNDSSRSRSRPRTS